MGVEQLLDQLEASGARTYDAPACDCIRALLTRAEELGGAVGERLVARAFSHATGLRERFSQDQQRVLARVQALEASCGPQEELRQLVERGDLVRVARATRRMAVQPGPRRSPVSPERTAVTGPRSQVRRDPTRERRKRAVVYEDSVAALVASFALARAVDVVPEDAGPYNPLRIASDTLDRMREVSPFYLTVQLNRLEELASLLALPELPQLPEEKALPRKKPKGLKGGH
jgi:hypothetical protein